VIVPVIDVNSDQHRTLHPNPLLQCDIDRAKFNIGIAAVFCDLLESDHIVRTVDHTRCTGLHFNRTAPVWELGIALVLLVIAGFLFSVFLRHELPVLHGRLIVIGMLLRTLG
jgi:hypothetical protein